MRLLKAKIWEAVDGLCGLCGIEVPLTEMTIDHILPLVLGGNHVYSNVQPAHYDCNVHRGIRPLAGCAA